MPASINIVAKIWMQGAEKKRGRSTGKSQPKVVKKKAQSSKRAKTKKWGQEMLNSFLYVPWTKIAELRVHTESLCPWQRWLIGNSRAASVIVLAQHWAEELRAYVCWTSDCQFLIMFLIFIPFSRYSLQFLFQRILCHQFVIFYLNLSVLAGYYYL